MMGPSTARLDTMVPALVAGLSQNRFAIGLRLIPSPFRQTGSVLGVALFGTSPKPENYDPDLWTDELTFLSRPGQADIQTELFFDYQTNVASYPAWQQWLRAQQPPLLVTWGRYDPSFEAAEAAAYARDVPAADVHLLEAGHFALEEQPDEIAKTHAPISPCM